LFVVAAAALLRASVPASPHLLLGNPSHAITDESQQDNYLLVKKYYALAYDDATGSPRWVSWRLVADDLGDAPRKRQFSSDVTLPASFKHVDHKDYANGGFDRGHMCPHSDRGRDRESSYSTFVMTNIIPQAPNVNQGAWNGLEIYLRELAQQGNVLYIISGPAGVGGEGSKGFAKSLANGKVTVPAYSWKIAVVFPPGSKDDPLKSADHARVIAVLMPNDKTVHDDWAPYRVSPAKIEELAGLHFFTNVPAETAKAWRAHVDQTNVPFVPLPNHWD